MPNAIVLLDVDGVLNRITTRNHATVSAKRRPGDLYPHPRRDRVGVPGVGEFPIIWSPAQVEALRDVAETSDATWRWCTTWDRHTPLIEHLMHIDWMGGFESVPDPMTQAAAKKQAVRRAVAQASLVAWIDDAYARPLPEWTAEREANRMAHCTCGAVRVLTIAPDEEDGLTVAQVGALAEFLGA